MSVKKCFRNQFCQKNIDSDIPNLAKYTDPYLVNPWGIALSPRSVWITDNANGLFTAYDFTLKSLNDVVTVLSPTGGVSAPTGVVYNPITTDFIFSNGNVSGHAIFIIVTENGSIHAWNPSVDPSTALAVISNQSAVYKGCALYNSQLYVCNFSSGFIEIYDNTFTFKSQFTDSNLTSIGYAPFNIYVANNQLYVTFAKQDDAKHDDVAGLGNGFIDVFNPDGSFVQMFYGRGVLNAPWGMLKTCFEYESCGCCTKQNVLVVGNFGDGIINVFDLDTGNFIVSFQDYYGNTIFIDSLWGLALNDDGKSIIFAAGVDSESHGLAGLLKNHKCNC